jgi:hypothetical protein
MDLRLLDQLSGDAEKVTGVSAAVGGAFDRDAGDTGDNCGASTGDERVVLPSALNPTENGGRAANALATMNLPNSPFTLEVEARPANAEAVGK